MLSQPRVAHPESPLLSAVQQVTWTVSNLCRGSPTPPLATLLPVFPVVAALVHSDTEPSVLTDACWALSYLSDGTDDRIQAVIETNVTRRLVDLLSGDRPRALTPALRTVGNIVTGSTPQTQVAINCGALQQLRKLLCRAPAHPAPVVKEACWALSNITAGSKPQVDAAIASGCIPELVRLLKHGDMVVRREAVWAICNAASGKDATQVQHLVQLGCIRPLCELLSNTDTRIVLVALEGLRYILETGRLDIEEQNVYATIVEEAFGLDALEALQNSEDDEVAARAIKVLTDFFEVDTAEENVAPAVDAAGMFSMQPQPVGAAVSFADL